MSRCSWALGSAIAINLLLTQTGCRNASEMPLKADREQCQRNLRSLEVAIKSYADEHDGRLPKALDDALAGIGFGDAAKAAKILKCPGASEQGATRQDVASLTHYCYINWGRWFPSTNSPPESYPLIYDSTVHNHGGRGVNIISVGARARWDEGARWLHDFAAKHPEYDLRLPD